MSTALTCTWTSPQAGTAQVVIEGELEYTTAAQLPRLVGDRLADAPGVEDVRLDCDGLEFCDSSGLSALLRVHALVTDAGRRLHLDNRRPALDRLLALTGTFTYLTGEAPASRARADS
ncbi:STAS domain-containing protein [Amycolatopsis sp., V23-08]|uniref:STAS domain-containing protein n=1 Tax=Amycolatopsis heterodermiae TaxID=3110235 RepID=A0ABU5R6U3_9PSEU|nr:STAS domain-containing protein [Amycolatopsis sp., V23-08]MEA5361565.1 STAS domain-containing protein [Amycolatopsis sp., V23-08]